MGEEEQEEEQEEEGDLDKGEKKEEEEEKEEKEEGEAEGGGEWDATLRGLRLLVGTRIFVDEGKERGVSGRRAVPFCAAISSSSSDCRYGVRPFVVRQQDQPVPASAFSKSSSWLADAALRIRGHMASQQKKEKPTCGCGVV
jgi:hypothetical protein